MYNKHLFQVCDAKGKQQHKAAVNVNFLIQMKGGFLPASKKEEEDVVPSESRGKFQKDVRRQML